MKKVLLLLPLYLTIALAGCSQEQNHSDHDHSEHDHTEHEAHEDHDAHDHSEHDHSDHDAGDAHDEHAGHSHAEAPAHLTGEDKQRWETNAHFATELGEDKGEFWPLKQSIVDCLVGRMGEREITRKASFLFPEFTLLPDGTVENVSASGSNNAIGWMVKDCIEKMSAEELKLHAVEGKSQIIDFQIQISWDGDELNLHWFF